MSNRRIMQIVPVNEYLTPQERKQLLRKQDGRAALEILQHYLWIIVAFALVYYWTNILTILVALFMLGGKQLACAILMHDAGHFAVFKNKRWNDWAGRWLGAYPVFNNLDRYRHYHFTHHQHTGLEEDPDLLLTRGYPTSRRSIFRKFFRDFTGQTGIKTWFGLLLMHLGYLEYNTGNQIVRVDQSKRSWTDFFRVFAQNLGGPLVANAILFLLLAGLASAWLYLLWIVAFLTTFQFSLRVRSIAEHSMVEDTTDPYQNTRTTKASWLERMLFAPYHVNYHVEHHMLMAVPSYNLPQMHQLLVARQFYQKGRLANSYWDIIKQAGSAR